MAKFLTVHPQNPQQRLMVKAAEVMRQGGLVAYPTDSSYAIGCHLDDKEAVDRIRRIRKLDRHHNFTLIAQDMKQVSQFAKIDNEQFRLLKALTPGPYTFIFAAKRSVPNRLMHPKRRTIGVRIPDHAIVGALIDELNEPIMSSTLSLPGYDFPLGDPEQIRSLLAHEVDLIIDGGIVVNQPSTVIDWHDRNPVVVRQGAGPADFLSSE